MRKLAKDIGRAFLCVAIGGLYACTQATTSSSSNGNSGTVDFGANSQGSASLTVPAAAYQDRPFSFDLSGVQPAVTSVTLQNAPSWLKYNSSSQKLEGIPTSFSSVQNISDFKVLLSLSDGTTRLAGPYSFTLNGDPLKQYQWNLKNTGQSAFAKAGGNTGMDINVDAAHASGVVGSSSVVVVVSDGRIDLSHEDLAANADLSKSRNYTLSSPYLGNPNSTDATASHGTTVASILAAVGWNNIGIRGVCPFCKLVGFNFLDSDQSVAKQISQASISEASAINYSYGYGTCEVTPADPSYLGQIRSATLYGRGGRGNLFVTASGNDFSGYNDNDTCNFAYLGNSNLDQEKSSPYFVTAAATDALGDSAEYSTPGANVWVSAPGGDGGQDKPGIVAADLEGCANGESLSTSKENSFQSNANGLNPSCKYTATATGTSFASPTVAGVVALILSANPSLSWRDVKYILAKTAKELHPTAGNVANPLGYDLANHVYEQGWITNAAGFKFHNWFGFGLVDAGAAVALAKSYNNNLGQLYITEDAGLNPLYNRPNLTLTIPDNSATGVSDKINVTDNLKVEAVQISVNITHTSASDLGIELYSPSGTKSIVMNTNSAINQASLTGVTFLSNAFYQENSAGNWTLKVIDGAAKDTGTLKGWSLKIWGGRPGTSAQEVAKGGLHE